MEKREKKKLNRWFKHKYLKLLRAPGGPTAVARGFGIGLGLEFITLATGGLAFFLIFPLVWVTRSSLAGAMIGFVFGKLIFLPLLPITLDLGRSLLPLELANKIIHYIPHWFPRWLRHSLNQYIYILFGGAIVGGISGLVMFFPIRYMLQNFTAKRLEKRKLKLKRRTEDEENQKIKENH